MRNGLLFILTLAVLLNYVDRGSLALAAPILQDQLHLSNTQLGILLSAFFWVYAPSQIIAGWAVHRFKLSIVLAGGVLLWSVATALMGAANGFIVILLLRLLLGLGESATFPSYQLILSRHASEAERGRANGIIGAGQGIGPMMGTLVGGLVLAHFGWRPMFVGMGLITLLWLWPWWRITRDGTLDGGEFAKSPSVSYSQILRQKTFWG
jgi:MFS family permease